MNITDITEALEAIRNLPMDDMHKRQLMLVSLLAEMVNEETSYGEGTELHDCLEGQDWWRTLDCLTRDAGFKRLGNGHFSAAYSHPMLPGRVIKVGFKKEDSGAAYTAFCRMHQGRPGIPNIYDVQRHEGCYTVVLDALVECDRYDNDEHDKYADIARDVIEYNSSEHDDLTGWDAEFVETCKLIREFFHGIASFDMHSGNIMFSRGDVPYITDPVSFTAKERAFSVDPEELLKEIEEVAAEESIERCKRRHAKKGTEHLRHLNAMAKIRRRNKKLHRMHAAQCAAIRRVMRQKNRNEDRVKLLMGTGRWAQIWCMHNNADFAHLEEVMAARIVSHDNAAIACGGDLWIDKHFDAMFQG